MDTHDDRIDEQLRAAGARLRAESPSPAATETALAEVVGRGGSRRRMWWVVPAGVVAAAAATIGVLTLAGGRDEAIEDVPAVTPPATAVPTVPATPPRTMSRPATSSPVTEDPAATTTLPPPIAPVEPSFVGNPPLSASAAALGCPGTLGEIAAAIADARYPISRLACAGGDAVVMTSRGWSTGLRRQADGGWSPFLAPTEDIFIDALPIPPASLLERDLGDLDPVDATTEVRGLGRAIRSSDPPEFAELLGDRLAGDADPVPTVTAEVVDGADVMLITLGGIGDDSIGEVTYVVWYTTSSPTSRELTVDRAFLISRCSRGVAVDENGEPMDLCI